ESALSYSQSWGLARMADHAPQTIDKYYVRNRYCKTSTTGLLHKFLTRQYKEGEEEGSFEGEEEGSFEGEEEGSFEGEKESSFEDWWREMMEEERKEGEREREKEGETEGERERKEREVEEWLLETTRLRKEDRKILKQSDKNPLQSFRILNKYLNGDEEDSIQSSSSDTDFQSCSSKL
ncbi:hypothetical protein ADUPG1_003992, partial [Aduncisulcus paluster]